METKILLKYERSCEDMSAYHGFYFDNESVNYDAFIGKEIFIDVRTFSAEKVLEISNSQNEIWSFQKWVNTISPKGGKVFHLSVK